jgi:uncharacterized protein YodC (DUF2158 family)
MAEFKKGDLVKLKSGGPIVTVVEVEPNNLRCSWFDQSGKRHFDYFDPETVVIYTPPPQHGPAVVNT